MEKYFHGLVFEYRCLEDGFFPHFKVVITIKPWLCLLHYSNAYRVYQDITIIDVVRQLFKEKEFYRYVGSLTTPPCTEGVIWTIFCHETAIRQESLRLLRQHIMKKTLILFD